MGMSERSGIGGVRVDKDDEVPDADGGYPVTAATAPPRDRLTRDFNEGGPTAGEVEDNKGRAAAARAPLS